MQNGDVTTKSIVAAGTYLVQHKAIDKYTNYSPTIYIYMFPHD